jgi:hypothetical protein
LTLPSFDTAHSILPDLEKRRELIFFISYWTDLQDALAHLLRLDIA